MKKRLFATVVALCIVLGMLPPEVFAVESTTLAEPKVTRLTVSYDGGEAVELLGTQPTITMPAGSQPVFTVEFDSTELLNKVFVTSTKDGETKYLEAIHQGNQYITNGYFDPNDTEYVPGTIAVTYSKKNVEVTESTQVGEINLAKMKQELEAQGALVNGEVITGNDGSVSAQVVLGSYFSGIGETFVDASIKELTTSASIDSDEVRLWIDVYGTISSYALKGEDGKDYMLYFTDKDWTDVDSYIMLVHDISGNKYIQMALKGTGLKEVAGKMSQANKLAGAYLDYVSISKEMDSLREEIEANPVMTSSQKAEANQKINALENDKKLFMMGITFIPMFLGTAGVATPLMISALLAGYSSIADFFWDYRVGMIQGCDPIAGSFSEENEHPGWVAITKEYLSKNTNMIQENGNYFLAEESLPGFKIAPNTHVKICLHERKARSVNIGSRASLHIVDCKYRENEDNTVVGGTIGRGITIENQGELIFDEGIVEGNYGHTIVTEGPETKITINGGTVIGINGSIIQDHGGNGKITINGGTLQAASNLGTGIEINDSEVAIVDGVINCKYAVKSLEPNGYSGGTIQLKGGKITGSFFTNVGEITVNMKSGFINGDISVKKVLFQEGVCTGNVRGDDITIKDGEISGNIIGTGQILGGKINANGNLVPLGEGIIIAGGSISNINFSSGCIFVEGGTITNGIKTINGGRLTISRGTILGGISDESNHTAILKITKDSDIQVTGKSAFNKVPIIEADPAYSGGVMYYSSPDSQGVKMTIQEAANIDFSQPYMRLVADGVPADPSGGDQDDCTHDYASTVTAPTCTERGYTTHTCSKCGHNYQDSYTNALGHSFGGWVVTKEATSTTSGSRERTCTVCNHKETSLIPATGGSGGSSSGGSGSSSDDSGSSGGGSNSSGGGSNSSGSGSSSPSGSSNKGASASGGYQISSAKKVTGGSVTLSKENATAGQAVTVAVRPGKGYELDTLKVLDGSGKELRLRKEHGKYVFTMPSSKVSVEAVFRPIGQNINNGQTSGTFSDVPNSHWAKGAIEWASSNGFMNGLAGSAFAPEGAVTRQQVWMILARLSGQSPASMAEARAWAMNSGLTDGTTPGTPVTRQQMVTFLFRYCRLKNYPLTDSGVMTAFPDYAGSSNYAREALAWAVGNGVITGTKSGTLNPGGAATRAQFAVVLKRLANSVMEK